MILHTQRAGEGPALIMLHGLFGAARNLGFLVRALAARAEVLAMDLRNHGQSPRAPTMSFAEMARDVAETADALGVRTFRLVGHSLGGKTAMALALHRPERVERLVVMDVAPIAYRHGYDDFIAAMQAIPLRAGLTRAEADEILARAVKEAPMRAFLLNNLVLGERPHWRVGLDEIAGAMPALLAWDEADEAPYAGPTLFLRGAQSDYVGPAAAAAIARQFPHAEQKVIAGASHWLHADRPQETLAALEAFLFP